MRKGFSLVLVLVSVVVVAVLGSAVLSMTLRAVRDERYALRLRKAVDKWILLRLKEPSRGKVVGYIGVHQFELKRRIFRVDGFVFEEVDY